MFLNKKIKFAAFILAALIICSCTSQKEKLVEKIKSGENRLFNDSLKTFNDSSASEVFNNYIKFISTYPDDTAAGEYLFRAADLSNGLRRSEESVILFERVRKEYPMNRKAAAALFMEAFIYETALKNKDSAKVKYADFIKQYPSHPLYSSAATSLEQLNSNISDEDLIKMFEEKNKNINQ